MGKIKSFLSTPKRIALFAACLITLMGVLAAGSFFTVYAVVENQSVGKDAAVETALNDAGYILDEVTLKKTELSFDDGMFVYEIEFYAEKVEYEYKIKASNGVILTSELDGKDLLLHDTEASAENLITLKDAKSTAIKDAGFSQDEVTITKANFESGEGEAEYNIEFVCDNVEYEYEIDALSGKITSKKAKEIIKTDVDNNIAAEHDKDKGNSASQNVSDDNDNSNSDTQNTSTGNSQQNITKENYIGLDAAKNIALSSAGAKASEVSFTKAKFENDDGRAEYDIEFVFGNSEYEYEVDALSGKVISKSSENTDSKDKDNTQQNTSSDSIQQNTDQEERISVDSAKNIALSHAGFKASEVTFIKAKFESDDGIKVYDIEFVHDGVEYEYEINASTGAIIEFDSEYND